MEKYLQSTEDRRRVRNALSFESEAVPHLVMLRRLALRLVRNKAEAEDLVQETFAQALHSFDRYEIGTNCRAWLCKIMFHKRSQWVRSNARYCQFADEAEARIPDRRVSANPLPRSFIGDKMSHMLSSLPAKYRSIIWLAEVEEYTYREVSERLEIPIGTVMSRLHRGRKMLRRSYESKSDSNRSEAWKADN